MEASEERPIETARVILMSPAAAAVVESQIQIQHWLTQLVEAVLSGCSEEIGLGIFLRLSAAVTSLVDLIGHDQFLNLYRKHPDNWLTLYRELINRIPKTTS